MYGDRLYFGARGGDFKKQLYSIDPAAAAEGRNVSLQVVPAIDDDWGSSPESLCWY